MSEPRVIGPTVINKITRNLREFGYPTVTPEEVARQLAKPEPERDIIGMLAAGMLRDNGVESWIVNDRHTYSAK